ncbi:coiled-coil-helix-coiled-coil-helix domain-containing protein 7 [Contarinia nasturtii]|uniref:coiled-coil-helix-coiled-coil-helix domain-containing protein 7 n=1 Tax=Contarinia nasturtii TaxID=265458 RepID=UPI0012D4BFF9|nr:coiled-coil-helix-coiled-coil-helix domain-containing protein 7 [Contarinia nasturtii]
MRTPLAASEQDPCWKERQQMLKCLDANNYDKDKCEAFIQNGKKCKEFWLNIAIERRSNRTFPEYPVGEEREKIKAERMKMYQKPTIHIKK